MPAIQAGNYLVSGLSGTQRSVLLSTLYDPNRVMFVVTHGQAQADRLAQDLEELLPAAPVYVWEGHELMPYDEAEAAWICERSAWRFWPTCSRRAPLSWHPYRAVGRSPGIRPEIKVGIVNKYGLPHRHR